MSKAKDMKEAAIWIVAAIVLVGLGFYTSATRENKFKAATVQEISTAVQDSPCVKDSLQALADNNIVIKKIHIVESIDKCTTLVSQREALR